MYDTILLPTDGSPGMAKAIENALYQAERADATVHTLYVVDVRSYVVLPEDTQGRVVELLESDGRHAVEQVEALATDRGVEVETAVSHGVPQEEILAYADEHDVDLIVMGTHGRTGDEHRMLGSVAESVVRGSAAPVLTVRMTEEEMAAVPDDAPPEEQLRYIR